MVERRGHHRSQGTGTPARAPLPERREHAGPSGRVLALQKLGKRAVVAEALVREADSVDKAVTVLCKSAANGDVNAAKALIPWLNQALGMPTERRELTYPSSVDEIEQMDEEELARLVAEGRERRLRLVEESGKASDAGL